MKNEALGGASSDAADLSLIDYFEGQDIFKFIGGWKSFGVTWDVGETPPFTDIVSLDESLWVSWQKICDLAVRDLPVVKQKQLVKEIKRQAFKQSDEQTVELKFD